MGPLQAGLSPPGNERETDPAPPADDSGPTQPTGATGRSARRMTVPTDSSDESDIMGLLEVLKQIARGGRPLFEFDEATVDTAEQAVVDAIQALDGTPIIEQRELDEAGLEFVFRSRATSDVLRALATAFGPAAKPRGAHVAFPRPLRQLIDSRGGIRAEQTLFLRRGADGSVAFAMLWPWNGDKYATLKVGVYDERLAPIERTREPSPTRL